MPTLVPTKRPPAKAARKPRAWRAKNSAHAWDWKRIAYFGGALLAAVAIGAGVLYASTIGGTQTPPKAVPTAFVARQIVSSTLSGNTPVSTPTPLAVTPPPPVGATQLSPSAGPAFSAGPPAQVQQVTPVRPPPSAQPSQPGASAAGNPGASLPGNLVTTGATALRTPPTATAAALDSSISNDLYAINARATSLARAASALSGSQTPQASGTPRPAPTDTPIPTAAPPIPPQA